MTHAAEQGMRLASRWLLKSFIVFLALSALLAIGIVLFGDFGDFEVKVLITTTVVACASVGSLCCSAYAGRTGKRPPAIAGIAVTAAAAALVVAGAWAEADSEVYWKPTIVLTVYALAFAHALAVLAVRLGPARAWLPVATAMNTFALASLTAFMILFEVDADAAFKLVVVLAILAALGTLVVFVVARMDKARAGQATSTLSLTHREDGLFEDAEGRRYEVHEVSEES